MHVCRYNTVVTNAFHPISSHRILSHSIVFYITIYHLRSPQWWTQTSRGAVLHVRPEPRDGRCGRRCWDFFWDHFLDGAFLSGRSSRDHRDQSPSPGPSYEVVEGVISSTLDDCRRLWGSPATYALLLPSWTLYPALYPHLYAPLYHMLTWAHMPAMLASRPTLLPWGRVTIHKYVTPENCV